MLRCAQRYVQEAVEAYTRNGRNLTGNTITSISAGVYKQGMPPVIVNARGITGLPAPIMKKLRINERFEGLDYDGNERKDFAATVDTDGDYGENTSRDFLARYRLPSSCTFGIVVTTGTEYSEFLTKELNYDVLISTYRRAKEIAHFEWKKIWV